MDPLPRGSAANPQEALAAVARRGLERPPCVVSFSGGRDSSVVLAVVAAEARRSGLEPPIPVTLRFPEVESAEESRWQEEVIRSVGVSEWERVEITDELDLLGPIARDLLERFGLLWPANTHFHVPIFERATGGSVLTGFDGDGLFGGWRWERAQAALHRLVPFEMRDPLRITLAFAPVSVRRRVLLRGASTWATWLTDSAHRAVLSSLVHDEAVEPRRWDHRLDAYARRRFFRFPLDSLALVASDHDVQVLHPLADRTFLGSLADVGGAAGFGDRESATRRLFGNLLPASLVDRPTKAEFGGAFWGSTARTFAGQWNGTGIDRALIDGELLRQAWCEDNPSLNAATLLQALWLSRCPA